MFTKKTASPSQVKGLYYEKLALKYLKKQGLKFLQNNYHCRLGEIDLVMHDQGYIVFIEVRYRENSAFGNGLDTVNKSKQQKLIKTAQLYLIQNGLYEKVPTRFDVISISRSKLKPELSWVKNAFQNEITN
ncbi:YraN family protein [Gammaproteobacteria bacterium]|jgi:putative endonuclease|nr:YraN family protein [Gammaproteobacteria bacterium]